MTTDLAGSTRTTTGMPSRVESLATLEREVGVLVRRVRRVIGERARAVHPDLQPAAYLILAHVAGDGPLRASTVAGSIGLDKGAVSRHLQHLEDLGLVGRRPDPADGRATLVSATEEAVRRLEAVAAERRLSLDDRLAEWDAPELDEFASLLGRYNDALGRS